MSDEERAVFEVAFQLKITARQLIDEMLYEEFLGWCHFFEVSPPGWQDDHRASLIIRALGFKGDTATLFPSLGKVKGGTTRDVSTTLKGSAMFRAMLGAVGGDKLEL